LLLRAAKPCSKHHFTEGWNGDGGESEDEMQAGNYEEDDPVEPEEEKVVLVEDVVGEEAGIIIFIFAPRIPTTVTSQETTVGNRAHCGSFSSAFLIVSISLFL